MLQNQNLTKNFAVKGHIQTAAVKIPILVVPILQVAENEFNCRVKIADIITLPLL